MPLSKAKIKYIHSLEQKKIRRQENAFVAEGHKSVGDLLQAGCTARLIIATEEWRSPVALGSETERITVTAEELRKASLLLHPQQVLGVFTIPSHDTPPPVSTIREQLCLCLDGVQDPGNLGTIIRTADWFGISHIICSPSTADAYNPKVVQATMGSIARVRVCYTNLPGWLQSLPADTPIYGTMLDGEELYATPLSRSGVVVMGNEGSGISDEVARQLTHRLLIPPYPHGSSTAESLNVSIATAIICAEFRRRS
ncbi:MAG: RNA methyltransferase [Prevotellaceae bacterium]|nr:RNA methyltransferase [Prevotellaceae bacterium]MDY2749685.1 RNA methyltransferase [Prevotella sp.]